MGGAGILQNVANGSNIAFLSCYESTGRLFKARAARMQSSRVTTANRDYLENFPTGNWRVVNHAQFCSVHVFMLYLPHVHMSPSTPSSPQIQALHHHLHHGGPACQVDTGPARNTQSSVSPWDVFMLVFSPHNFSSPRFLEGFFSVGMLATYPK